MALIAAATAFGQEQATPTLHSIKPTTDFDQRFYYTAGERQNVWGYRIGAIINDKYKLGIGGYYMNRKQELGVPATTLSRTAAAPLSIRQQLYLGTVYYEPYLMRRKYWETSVVFETGYGRTVSTADVQEDGKTSTKTNALLLPLGAGLSVNFKLPALFHIQCFRWIGINAMGGYRASVYQEDKQYSYNGTYWSLGGAIFLDRMLEDFHAWKKHRAATRDSRVIEINY
ncbi:MAG: hypothetical protein ABIQ88_15895 [Chitinophagaceae bacterium]